MSSIAAITSNHLVALPADVEATLDAHSAVAAGASSTMSEPGLSNSSADAPPLGGLHHAVHEPGSALFKFITDAWHEVLKTSAPPSLPPTPGSGQPTGSQHIIITDR
jgi:hypothetical protein